MKPQPEEWWRRRRDGRVARVIALSGPPWNLVTYRFTRPPERSRGLGMLAPRTNTTSMGVSKFEKEWEKIDVADAA